jgi:hypothetical protein
MARVVQRATGDSLLAGLAGQSAGGQAAGMVSSDNSVRVGPKTKIKIAGH